MLRKFFLVALLITLMTACAPQTARTPASAPAVAETSTLSPAEETASVSIRAQVTETSTALTFTDGLGREVTLKGFPQRIVSLAPSNTEILFAIGAGDQVVGRDQFSDYPEAAKKVTDIGSAFEALNTELIVSLKPDLVIAAEINTPEQVKALEDLGITVYYLNNPHTLEEMYGNLDLVAQLTGHQAETATLIESLKKRVAAVDEKIAPINSRPSVFYELDSTDPAKPYTSGKDTFITLLIDRAGGHNIAAELESYPQMSLEQIVAANPNFIILGDATLGGVTPEMVATRPGWENLAAVKNGKVVTFDDNLVSRPGPRLVDGLEQLAKLLHPEVFK
ncbi:MAG TPA: cobalamin-binding protein [Anaerolineales bacterium]|nr:cobalamin-binding protein [Anaerolineales bacterium]